MLDAIRQEPLIQAVVIAVAVGTVMWAVLQALYVKPRDFRISELEKKVDELGKEHMREVRVTKEKSASPSAVSTPTNSNPAIVQESGDPLRSLIEFHRQWQDEKKTDLQRQHFEDTYMGKIAEWDVFLSSVSKNEYFIAVYARARREEPETGVYAHFPLTDETKLLTFKENDHIRLRGKITDFFLYPKLEDTEIQRLPS